MVDIKKRQKPNLAPRTEEGIVESMEEGTNGLKIDRINKWMNEGMGGGMNESGLLNDWRNGASTKDYKNEWLNEGVSPWMRALRMDEGVCAIGFGDEITHVATPPHSLEKTKHCLNNTPKPWLRGCRTATRPRCSRSIFGYGKSCGFHVHCLCVHILYHGFCKMERPCW